MPVWRRVASWSTPRWLLAVVLGAGVMSGLPTSSALAASPVVANFQEQVVFAGLTKPTDIVFAPDGRIFVAEKAGVIKEYDSVADTTPTTVADLSGEIMSWWDRGLLGLAVPPTFPADPWLYVAYTYDAHNVGDDDSACRSTDNGGCVVSARLSRLKLSGNTVLREDVLITDWCQQYPSHSIGDMHFGPDGALYVSAGEGANFSGLDYGQSGNPCGDPQGATPPATAEGGALRAQDLRTTGDPVGDPTGLSGAVIRIDPTTGFALPSNPNGGSSDAGAARIVANGLRNPFRFAVRPDTGDLWVGDVGSNRYEEIDVVPSPGGRSAVPNFGWPCYEGPTANPTYDTANVNLCESLYAGSGQTAPYYAWRHGDTVATSGCHSSGDSITGLAFYPTSGGSYPDQYRGALFFADYTLNCIGAMLPATPGGAPDSAHVVPFSLSAATPVDLAVGPDGDLYYVDIVGGTVRRFAYFPNNTPPTAVVSTSASGGPVPLTVSFDAAGSFDPDADDYIKQYDWDFDNDGTVDATGPTASHTYTTAGTYTAKLTVYDSKNAAGSATVSVVPGSKEPTPVIDTPVAGTTWRVGQTITFSGHATDLLDGREPASRLQWSLRLRHCTGGADSCHTHFLRDWPGVATGSFAAPDHDYPSYLELVLTATNSHGLSGTTVRRLDPRTVDLTFTAPVPVNVAVADTSGVTPFTQRFIQGSQLTVVAPVTAMTTANRYDFRTWSDRGGRTHTITAPATATTYQVDYTPRPLVNFAHGASATADSQCAAAEGPDKAIDGSVSGGHSDKWCSLGSAPWLQVDLGQKRSVAGFALSLAGAGGEAAAFNLRDYTIAVSDDATSWTTVVTVTGNTSSVVVNQVAATGRYVRLAVTRPTSTTDTAARVYDFQALGVLPAPPPDSTEADLALGAVATADSQCAPANGPAQAINGRTNGGVWNAWCSDGAHPWLQVDLGRAIGLTGIVVYHAGAGGEPSARNTRDFTIEVSSDGVTWTNVVTVAGNGLNVTNHPVAATARYVRLHVVTASSVAGDSRARIYELVIHGSTA